MFENLRKKKKGFTLIELIIVIAIIAILGTIAIPKFADVRKSAKEKVDIANAKTIANAAAVLLEQGEVESKVAGEVISGSIVGSYIQTIPTLQDGGNFTVVVTNGVVSVTNGAKTIYPK